MSVNQVAYDFLQPIPLKIVILLVTLAVVALIIYSLVTGRTGQTDEVFNNDGDIER